MIVVPVVDEKNVYYKVCESVSILQISSFMPFSFSPFLNRLIDFGKLIAAKRDRFGWRDGLGIWDGNVLKLGCNDVCTTINIIKSIESKKNCLLQFFTAVASMPFTEKLRSPSH